MRYALAGATAPLAVADCSDEALPPATDTDTELAAAASSAFTELDAGGSPPPAGRH